MAPKVLVTLKTKNIENISEKDNTRKQFSCVIIKEIPCDFWHRNVSIHLNFMNLKEVIVKVYVVSTKKHYKWIAPLTFGFREIYYYIRKTLNVTKTTTKTLNRLNYLYLCDKGMGQHEICGATKSFAKQENVWGPI